MATDRALIVGGGIGGFATALALAQEGMPSRLVDAADSFGEVGAGIQLGPNVFKMFDRLGLTEAVNAVAVFPDALEMRDARTGETIADIPLTGAFRDRFGYPYGVIYRPDLHRILQEAALATGMVEAANGVKIVDHAETGDGVTATTEAGDRLAAPWMVAADGLWSRARGRIVGDGKPRVSGHIAYRAVLPIEDVPPHLRRDRVVLWAGPKTHLVGYPLRRGDLFNLVVVFHSDRYEEGWNVFGDPEELRGRFAGQHADVLALLDKVDTWRMWVLCDREPTDRWVEGRVGLLGDAAHPMLQYLAQGACMAIEDAVCLATKMAATPDDPHAALTAYCSARSLRTARVQLTARFYGDVYHASGATAALRNHLLAKRRPEQSIEGMAWLYDGTDENGDQKL